MFALSRTKLCIKYVCLFEKHCCNKLSHFTNIMSKVSKARVNKLGDL